MPMNQGLEHRTAKAQGMKRRYILAVVIGNALEFYDFLIYAFF
jgi:hypothetical protein